MLRNFSLFKLRSILRACIFWATIASTLSACTAVGYRDDIVSKKLISKQTLKVQRIWHENISKSSEGSIIKIIKDQNVTIKEDLTLQKIKVVVEENLSGDWNNKKKTITNIGEPYQKLQENNIDEKNVPYSSGKFEVVVTCGKQESSLVLVSDEKGELDLRYEKLSTDCDSSSIGDLALYRIYCRDSACNDQSLVMQDTFRLTKELIAHTKTQNNIPSPRKISIQAEQVSTLSPRINPNFTFSGKIKSTQSAVAVIIGNSNYKKGVPNVDFAHNDADLMKRYVVEGLGYREGNVIDLRDATQADFISVFGNKENHKGQIFSWVRPGESDVFVYYSGHGAPGLSNGQGYMLPVDANPNTVELNGYPLETLYTNLGKLPGKSLTVVIDACFSGSSQAGSVVKNASAISLKRVDTKNTLPNATILTAAGLSEVASWDEEAKLGLFTRHFLEGVTGKADQGHFGNGDGQVTLGELKNYLESEVTYMARRLYMREQHPQVSGNINSQL